MSKTNNIPEGIPSYPDDRYIELGSFAGLRRAGYRYWNNEYGKHPEDPEGGWKGYLREQDFKDYLAAGFTFALPEGDGWYDFNEVKQIFVDDFKESDLYPYMEMAEKVGLPVVASTRWMVESSNSLDLEMTDEVKVRIDKIVEELSQYKMFKGFMLHDEPVTQVLPSFIKVQKYLENVKPDIFMYTCMIPIYGRATCFSSDITADKVEAYKDYVRTVAEGTGSFVYDHYPLFIDYRDPEHVQTLLEEDYFQNMEIVAQITKEMKVPSGLVVQSSSWGAWGKEKETCHPRNTFTKADISFQVYSGLAYGMKSIGYYTYWEHYTQHDRSSQYSAMLMYPMKEDGTPDPDGEPVKTPAYYAVKEMNEELKKFDHVFLRFDWEGTMAVIPDGAKQSDFISHVEEYYSPRIKQVSASEETIVGCQKDEQGYDGFMIVNITDPAHMLKDTVKIQFTEATSALCYINGDEQLLPLQEGILEYTLEAGQGIFVIPIK